MPHLPEYLDIENLDNIRMGETIRHYFASIKKDGEIYELEYEIVFKGLFDTELDIRFNSELVATYNTNNLTREFFTEMVNVCQDDSSHKSKQLRKKFIQAFHQ